MEQMPVPNSFIGYFLEASSSPSSQGLNLNPLSSQGLNLNSLSSQGLGLNATIGFGP
jgi:hypothetical protein